MSTTYSQTFLKINMSINTHKMALYLSSLSLKDLKQKAILILIPKLKSLNVANEKQRDREIILKEKGSILFHFV